MGLRLRRHVLYREEETEVVVQSWRGVARGRKERMRKGKERENKVEDIRRQGGRVDGERGESERTGRESG